MRIAIVGSSVLSDSQRESASNLIELIAYSHYECTLISGGAAGVDSIAEDECRQAGWDSEIYYPSLLQWEPNGYKDRNLKIAEACDVLYCIRSRESQTYGSGWTADRAEEMGKKVYRYYV